MNIGVIGAGTWGVALARMLGRQGHRVLVWSSSREKAARYEAARVYPGLDDMAIPETVHFTADMAAACRGEALLVFAVPSVYVRETAAKAAPHIAGGMPIVSVAKGIEPGTLYNMTEVMDDELKKQGVTAVLSALTGPTHAEEVARDMPTAIVAAADTAEAAELVQNVFMNENFRVYTSTDMRGVELCGAMKNIIAIASGIMVGLGYGDNARAALITRGMAEIMRLGRAMGCSEQTFFGLAGIGDLIVTTGSRHSRNNRFGMLIGAGRTTQEALDEIGMVVEGLNALPAAMELSARYGVEMPITHAIHRVIHEGASPAAEARGLMIREKKGE